jgi:hypothetical protein
MKEGSALGCWLYSGSTDPFLPPSQEAEKNQIETGRETAIARLDH